MSSGIGESQPGKAIAPDRFSRRCKWLLIGTFCIAYALAAITLTQLHQSHVASQRLTTKMLAQGYAQRIQERLQTALVSTYVLASIVKQTHGYVRDFDNVAAELITLFPSVSALQLAPDGVVRNIYPLEGNEGALGHDLLADRKRNREAVAAITTQQLTLAGPFDLVQGGVGAVGRMPVFLVNDHQQSYFWGFANALVRIPNLLDAAGVTGLAKAGYRYELWRVNPENDVRQVFARSGDQPPVNPVEYVITVYNGRWILSLAPADGWITSNEYAEILGYSLIAAIVITLLQGLVIAALQRERR